ncbi:hypothetical protein K0H59_07130 [Shewanella sp. FJAT-51649]|uniref:hypothetical protein n=1 Tax=Shewanella sp. FJAT-51649 TaxID=2864210 RepID=UPI001C65E49F|nr:hypothetical protein [Shewanella sp. FJAT-51649]QYJ72796.1 hypothetical protein K0H59_07130 [Shewanella sp. FJAT-51649]
MKALFISPDFFSYKNSLIQAFEFLGYEVHWINHIPNNSPIVKAFSRKLTKVTEFFFESYYKNKINFDDDYDVVFVIKGEGISANLLKYIRNRMPKAKYIFYNWDSLDNSKFALKKLSIFDKCFTFDFNDSISEPLLTFHPLFYTFDTTDVLECDYKENIFACSFIGTLHSERYKLVNEIAKQVGIKTKTNNNFIYFYYPSRFFFLVNKYFLGKFKDVTFKSVKFEPLSYKDVKTIMASSNYIIDIPNTDQSGLTMRVFEALGLKRKLITTASSIENYDFYDANNIIIYKDIESEIDFNLSSYNELPKEIYDKYNVISWLEFMLKNEN